MSASLEDELRARIRAHGPLRFDRFMEAALYDPARGFYAKGPLIGPGGAFSTSVRFPAFRAAMLRLVETAHDALGQPPGFRVVELGAGTGQLARAILEGWTRGELDYRTVDASPALRERQREAGARAVASMEEIEPGPALVFGNEVLDAFPVRRIVGGPAGLLEVHVDLDRGGRFRDRLLPLDDDAPARRLAALGIAPQRGQICDVAMPLDGFVRDAAALVAEGFLLFIDYGDPAPRLYAPTRINGTLAAYRSGGRHHDPYANVGDQDLTADVDWTTVARAAAAAGMEELGIVTQQELLEALGVRDLGLPDEVRQVAGAASLGSAFQAVCFRRATSATLPAFG